MHEIAFADCTLPAKHTVLKRQLRDFSIGHRLLLIRQRNPILLDSENGFDELSLETQIMWLIEAVVICARSYADRAKLEQPSLLNWRRLLNSADMAAWHWHRRGCPLGLWKLKIFFTGGVDWALELAHFRIYLNASRLITDYDSQTPGFAFLPCKPGEDSGSRFSGAPYEAILIQFLLGSGLACNAAAAMEFPFASAQIHFLAHLEREGRLKIMNEAEVKFEQDWNEQELAKAKEAGFDNVKDYIVDLVTKAKAQRKNKDVKQLSSAQAGLATKPPAL
jgi:hypothetical protein